MMKTARVLGILAVAAALVLSGCSTATEGRAQDDSISTNVVGECPSGYILTKIGKCAPADATQPTPTTTTSPAAPNANPIPASEPDVSACDGTQCDLSTSDDEVDRLVAESLTDVAAMWDRLNVDVTLHLYKDGTVGCQTDSETATAWVCVKSRVGGWNPAEMRKWATDHGTSLEDTIRATVAHEVGHIVIEKFGATSPDMVTNETRADCMAGGYAKWTMTTSDSAMGQLSLDTTKRVLKGPRRNAAVEAGFTGTPKTCVEYTP